MKRRPSLAIALLCALQLVAGLAFAPAEMPVGTAHRHEARAAMTGGAMHQMSETPSDHHSVPGRLPCHSRCCLTCVGCTSALSLASVPPTPAGSAAGRHAAAPDAARRVRVTHLASARLPYAVGPPSIVRV